MHRTASRWTVRDAAELYDVSRWGAGYFSIGENGHLHVHPDRDADRAVDLKALVEQLEQRDLGLPILLRFNGILRDRLESIHHSFQEAIQRYGYQGQYHCIYPIKVNQQREVVEQVVHHGNPLGFGLEAGSKPELLAVIATAPAEMPIICNGFKDHEFIEMAMIARKMGRQIITVVEKYSELELILEHAEALQVAPQIGFRVKLASSGSGRWQSSGGYRSKFGLTVGEILRALDTLAARGMAACCELLHFHLGSQITNIRRVKAAINEAARIYVSLRARAPGLRFLDVGGGLGVDYDGSRTNFDSSMNYTMQEYANDVVYHIQAICDEAEVPHPNIISESGRAIAAHHSLLVFNTLGVTRPGDANQLPQEADASWEQPVLDLWYALADLTAKNALETFHDAQVAWDMAMNLFGAGYLGLEQRVLAENLYFQICHKLEQLTHTLEDVPEELQGLKRMLSDTYFCNFSLFQSMPDSWAIHQLFPVMPIHRLDQRPTREAVLGDITCDSDGKIDTFIDRRDVKRSLPLHEFDGSPYLLAAFLVGAYQEILGDLHNLFGDTHAVHVDCTEATPAIQAVVEGDTVREVLEYVQYDACELTDRLRASIDQAQQAGRLETEHADRFLAFFEDALDGYTYLEGPPKGRE